MNLRPTISLVSLPLLALCLGAHQKALASTYTTSGTFTTDNQVLLYDFSSTATEDFNFYTTSYAGGTNLNGTTSWAGGFVPVLTLFSASGNPLGYAGGSGMCSGSEKADATTGLCNDASLQETLKQGSYVLAMTEFPNVAINTLSDGFLFASDPHATGTACGKSGGAFLESDVAPCVQRDGNYSLNVSSSSPVPEPPTWALMLPLAGVFFYAGRQHLS